MKIKFLSIALCATPLALFGDFEPTYHTNNANICEYKQDVRQINNWGGGIARGIIAHGIKIK